MKQLQDVLLQKSMSSQVHILCEDGQVRQLQASLYASNKNSCFGVDLVVPK